MRILTQDDLVVDLVVDLLINRCHNSKTACGPDLTQQQQALVSPIRRQRRPKKRELFCPAHPNQQIQGNGKKYYLHLLQPEQLVMRGIPAQKARLIINAFPVFVLSHEWLESLYCPKCGQSHWCYVIKHDRVQHTVQWAPRELWEQVAHVDPSAANPTVSDFTRRVARRHQQKRIDGKRFYE